MRTSHPMHQFTVYTMQQTALLRLSFSLLLQPVYLMLSARKYRVDFAGTPSPETIICAFF